MKKLNKTERIIYDMAKEKGFKIFRCDKHKIFATDPNQVSKKDIDKCPYCKTKCEEYTDGQ